MKSLSRYLVVSVVLLSAVALVSGALARGGHGGGRGGWRGARACWRERIGVIGSVRLNRRQHC
jgi:hypothetical protein